MDRRLQEKCLEDFGGHRLAEQEALHLVAPEEAEQARLLRSLDTLGHDLEIQRMLGDHTADVENPGSITWTLTGSWAAVGGAVIFRVTAE